MSDEESSGDDIDELEQIGEFDEIMEQITALHQSYEQALNQLAWLQTHIQPSIQIGDRELGELLNELHSHALQEIEETGESSFGTRLLNLL